MRPSCCPALPQVRVKKVADMEYGSDRVATVTGASQEIGDGLVTAYRKLDYAVIADSRSTADSLTAGLVTVRGDFAHPPTADHILADAVSRYDRTDTLINNAGLFLAKPSPTQTGRRCCLGHYPVNGPPPPGYGPPPADSAATDHRGVPPTP
jgi:NAD(P)-dependent dehydrogenase (short-subunit alcohol dehydrogenase family)